MQHYCVYNQTLLLSLNCLGLYWSLSVGANISPLALHACISTDHCALLVTIMFDLDLPNLASVHMTSATTLAVFKIKAYSVKTQWEVTFSSSVNVHIQYRRWIQHVVGYWITLLSDVLTNISAKNMHWTSDLQMRQQFVFACLQNRNVLDNLCFLSGVLFNEAWIYILLTLLFIYTFYKIKVLLEFLFHCPFFYFYIA